jgi:6-pyruvoyltetrahydropterin/6-carboxytetrahydropterin synthase
MQAFDNDISTFTEFPLEVAHQVEGISTLHGHTLFVRLYFRGKNDPKYEWPVSLYDVKKNIKVLREKIGKGDEHGDGEGEGNLTDIPDIGVVGSLERITRWIWSELKPNAPGLVKMIVYRGIQGSFEGCEYEGPPVIAPDAA